MSLLLSENIAPLDSLTGRKTLSCDDPSEQTTVFPGVPCTDNLKSIYKMDTHVVSYEPDDIGECLQMAALL